MIWTEAQIRSATDDAAGSRPPPPKADCSEGGTRLEFFLAVIIQGGINAPNSAIIPQCDRLPTDRLPQSLDQ